MTTGEEESESLVDNLFRDVDDQFKDLEREYSTAREGMATADTERRDSSSDSALEASTERFELMSQVATLKAEISRQADELDERDRMLAELGDKIAGFQADIGERDEMVAELHTARQEVLDEKREQARLSALLDARAAEREELTDVAHRLQNERDHVQELLATALARFDEAESKLVQMDDKLRHIEAARDTAAHEHDARAHELIESRAEMSKLTDQLSELTKSAAAADVRAEKSEALAERRANESGYLNRRIDAMNDKLTTAGELEEEATRLRKELTMSERRITELQRLVATHQSEASAANAAVDAIAERTADYDELVARIEILQQERDEAWEAASGHAPAPVVPPVEPAPAVGEVASLADRARELGARRAIEADLAAEAAELAAAEAAEAARVTEVATADAAKAETAAENDLTDAGLADTEHVAGTQTEAHTDLAAGDAGDDGMAHYGAATDLDVDDVAGAVEADRGPDTDLIADDASAADAADSGAATHTIDVDAPDVAVTTTDSPAADFGAADPAIYEDAIDVLGPDTDEATDATDAESDADDVGETELQDLDPDDVQAIESDLAQLSGDAVEIAEPIAPSIPAVQVPRIGLPAEAPAVGAHAEPEPLGKPLHDTTEIPVVSIPLDPPAGEPEAALPPPPAVEAPPAAVAAPAVAPAVEPAGDAIPAVSFTPDTTPAIMSAGKSALRKRTILPADLAPNTPEAVAFLLDQPGVIAIVDARSTCGRTGIRPSELFDRVAKLRDHFDVPVEVVVTPVSTPVGGAPDLPAIGVHYVTGADTVADRIRALCMGFPADQPLVVIAGDDHVRRAAIGEEANVVEPSAVLNIPTD